VYRRLGRVEDEWVFLKPEVCPSHFEALDDARHSTWFFDEAQDAQDRESAQRRGHPEERARHRKAIVTLYWTRDDE
jgi:hypothetical protein